MAKVVLPLLSAEARGKIADALVFFPLAHAKGGQPVRRWLKPANPQSAAQGTTRIKMAAMGSVIPKVIHIKTGQKTDSSLATQWKALCPANKIWNAFFVEKMGGAAFATIDQALTDYANHASADSTDFKLAAAGLAMEDTTLTYGVPPTITAGEKLFVAAHACYLNGITQTTVDAQFLTTGSITTFAAAFAAA